MTTEEKAKAYDEAIKRGLDYIRHTPATEMVTRQDIFEAIFPELAESEDEKIKKFIKEQLYKIRSTAVNNSNLDIKLVNAIDWLEKQKAIDVLDAEEREFADNVNSYRKDMDEFYKKGYDAGREAEKQYWLGKQDEQKDYVVDEVEPKFREGDWAVSNLDGKARQISEVHFDEYNSYYVVDGKSVNLEEYDRLHHLWTIQDAKDGDVLAAHECYVIFKEIDWLNIKCYCTYHYMNNPSFHVDTLHNKDAFHPATKEQRDTLMKAMADDGYTFDFEKKELKNVEEKVNGEDYGIDGLYHAQEILERTLGEVDGYQSDDGILEHKCAISAVKKLYEQKPIWSEDDMSKVQRICKYLDEAKKYYADINEVIECMDWLKSLKDRYTWKPSDEQVKALISEVEGRTKGSPKQKVLESLYNDLKKLK